MIRRVICTAGWIGSEHIGNIPSPRAFSREIGRADLPGAGAEAFPYVAFEGEAPGDRPMP